MKFRDLVEISGGNLRRMKLRAFLTISGVVIAIAAFVAMLSFGAGMKKNVTEQFDELGLFSTMQVYPERENEANDTLVNPVLNDSIVVLLSQIDGVRLAYPYDDFPVKVQFADTTLSCDAQALPLAAASTRMFSRIETGRSFESDSAFEVIVTSGFLRDAEIEAADSLIGKPLVLSVEVSSVDSALMYVVRESGKETFERIGNLNFDSLKQENFLQRLVSQEATRAMGNFVEGYMNARETIADTLTIVGVLDAARGRSRTEPLLVPVATARKFTSSGFTGDPTKMFSALTSGTLFADSESGNIRDYSRVTLDLDPAAAYQPIKDSVTALGFRSFSYAEEFDEILKAFRHFNMALSAIGLIALLTAALGIVNTMVMSIIERRREIGILKSLGADEREIKLLFLVESGVIGSIGAIVGIIFGWLITRIASLIAQSIMANEGVDAMELFDLPIWLIVTAYLFGLIVSLVAGYYPARRAARVDPVEALRTD
ncbi:MAG: FtsX-like permease family protein [bacterium]|nr:FtsX-like permease family protein [bacterium]